MVKKEYRGQRTADAILEFIKEQLKDPITIIEKTEDIKKGKVRVYLFIIIIFFLFYFIFFFVKITGTPGILTCQVLSAFAGVV